MKTAAIDVWALGSAFVKLLTGDRLWDEYSSSEDARELIGNGTLPHIPRKYTNSSDPVETILYSTIKKCLVFEPKDRPKATVISNYLKEEAKKLNVEWEFFDINSLN